MAGVKRSGNDDNACHPWTQASGIDQLQRAALSVQLNIAEGYALKSSQRFRNHLAIAYGSAVETAELLELTSDLNLVPANWIGAAEQRCHRCQALLLGLIKKLRNT